MLLYSCLNSSEYDVLGEAILLFEEVWQDFFCLSNQDGSLLLDILFNVLIHLVVALWCFSYDEVQENNTSNKNSKEPDYPKYNRVILAWVFSRVNNGKVTCGYSDCREEVSNKHSNLSILCIGCIKIHLRWFFLILEQCREIAWNLDVTNSEDVEH